MKKSKFFADVWRLALGSLALSVVFGMGGCPSSPPPPSGPPAGGPFTFTADTTSVNIPQNSLSADITFTLRSNGTFSGPVVVSWDATGDCTTAPPDNNVTIQVARTGATTFKRKMYRWGDNGRNVRFSARSEAENVTRTVNIALTHP